MMLIRSGGPDEQTEDHSYPDLLCGVTPFHIRMLCENPWDGGRGYTPHEVGEMTLDEIFMLLAKKQCLRKRGLTRISKMASMQVTDLADKDGFIKGKDEKGNLIRGRVRGKSLARQLMEEEARKRQDKEAKRGRRKR